MIEKMTKKKNYLLKRDSKRKSSTERQVSYPTGGYIVNIYPSLIPSCDEV